MIAVYPGSFDPVTSGHFDIIVRTAALYDQVIVLVAANSSKSNEFTTEQRVGMLETSVRGADLVNVQVDSFDGGLLVDYVAGVGSHVIVKGLRAVSDFEYEFQMALLNKRLAPSIETIFMMTSAEFGFLSSSIVKEIARLGGNIDGLVPPAIADFILDRCRRQAG